MRPRILAAVLLSAGVALWPAVAGAHPLGNLSTNTAAVLGVRPDRVDVAYVLDLAELPTVRERQQMDADRDGDLDAAEQRAYAETTCGGLLGGLELTRGGARLAVAPTSAASLSFPPGQAGLVTLRLVCHGSAPGTGEALQVRDTNRDGTTGWRELVAVPDGVTLDGDLPAASPSAGLTAYPAGAPQQRVTEGSARVTGSGPPRGAPLVPEQGASVAASRGVDGLTRHFADLVGSRHLTVGVGLLALAIAVALGALHALAPGHGKSLMAAVALGRSGATGQVLGIAATVCLTHTAGVLALGGLLWAGQAATPSAALPWLSVASGVLLAVTGLSLLVARWRGRPLGLHQHGPGGHTHGPAHHHDHDHDDHDHHHDHDHHAHDHDHDHDHDHEPARAAGGVRRRSVVLMGVAGGLVPTPSALVVLLGATALGRAWFGVVLVLAYGVGMSSALLVTGWALVRLQDRLGARLGGRPWWERAVTVAPVLAAAALLGAGALLTARAVALL